MLFQDMNIIRLACRCLEEHYNAERRELPLFSIMRVEGTETRVIQNMRIVLNNKSPNEQDLDIIYYNKSKKD